MSTKTMRAPPRRVSASNKRKEREGSDPVRSSSPTAPATKDVKPIYQLGSGKKLQESISSNQLLAGYLAHEYLTRGTLFGKHWEPDRAEAEPSLVDPTKGAELAEPNYEQYQRYVEVAGLLKAEGAHLPGIVNPCQLSGFFHM